MNLPSKYLIFLRDQISKKVYKIQSRKNTNKVILGTNKINLQISNRKRKILSRQILRYKVRILRLTAYIREKDTRAVQANLVDIPKFNNTGFGRNKILQPQEPEYDTKLLLSNSRTFIKSFCVSSSLTYQQLEVDRLLGPFLL